MTDKTKKIIGFRQKVPYQILENGLYLILRDGKLDDEETKRDLQQHFKGANRLSKAFTTVNSVLKKNNSVILKLRRKLDAEDFLRLAKSDRAAIITSLLCLAYPFAYDTLITAASVFKIQDYITRDLLHQKIGAIYGSNRATYIGIGELLPTFIELGLFKRDKKSLYSKNEKKMIFSHIVSELYIYSDIKVSDSKSALVEDLAYRPWFCYYFTEYKPETFNNFLELSDAVGRGGYITIKKI
jgi:hypothetical protein